MSDLTDRSSSQEFVHYVLIYSPAIVIPAAMALISSATFTRIFSSEEYGYFSLVLAYVGPLTVVLSEWAGQPIGRFYAEFKENGTIPQFNQTVVFIAGIVVLAVTLGVGTVLVLSSHIDMRLPPASIWWGAVAVLVTNSMFTIFVRILPASFRSTQYRRVRLSIAVGSYVVALSGILATTRNVVWLLWAQALATGSVLPYVIHHSEVRFADFVAGSRHLLRRNVARFWKYGAAMMVWFFAAQLLDVGGRFVIGAFQGPSAVGIYSVNYGLVSQMSVTLNTIVLTASVPLIMRLFATNALGEAQLTIATITELYVLIAAALVGLLAVLDQRIAAILFGEQFHAGYVVMVPALIGSLVMGIAHLGHKSIELAEKTYMIAIAAVLAAILNFVLDIVFIPSLGYVSAAYASLISYVVYGAIIHSCARQFLPWRINWKGAALSVACAFLAGTAADLALSALSGSALVQMLIGGSVYGFVFFVLCAFLQSRPQLQLVGNSSLLNPLPITSMLASLRRGRSNKP